MYDSSTHDSSRLSVAQELHHAGQAVSVERQQVPHLGQHGHVQRSRRTWRPVVDPVPSAGTDACARPRPPARPRRMAKGIGWRGEDEAENVGAPTLTSVEAGPKRTAGGAVRRPRGRRQWGAGRFTDRSWSLRQRPRSLSLSRVWSGSHAGVCWEVAGVRWGGTEALLCEGLDRLGL